MLQCLRRSTFVFVITSLILFSLSSLSYSYSDPFKIPNGLESKVNFWLKIYTQYTTDQVVIHDVDNLDIIYEVVDFSGQKHLSERAKRKKIKKIKNFYKKTLRKLARRNKKTKMVARERRLYNQVKKSFWHASKNIRAQLGQKDRFQEGLRRSGYYIKEMRKIFKEFGLPEDLTALPHVESSFQIGAYSKSGAVGIWQFIRSTGKRFMTINYAIDERRDPIKATVAAAKLLKANYEELDSWPLAITAYNHGLNGMKRAKKKLRSNDIVDVINDYKSRRFGFASENFYAGFLAALEASKNYQKYFPGLTFYSPVKRDSFKLPDFVYIKTLSNHFNMNLKEIALYNPSLRRPVLNSEQYLPAGFVFQLPKDRVANLRFAYSGIPATERFSYQKRTRWYRVHRGDTLGRIAKRFRTSVKALKSRNKLSRSGLIYVGQVLQLPGEGRIRTASLRQRKTGRQRVGQDKVFSGEYKKIVVRKNDNLDSISRKHDVSLSAILRENNIKNRNKIYQGQVLKIPKMIDKKDKIKLAKLENIKKKKSMSLEKASINKIELAEVNSEKVVGKKVENTSHLLPVSLKKDPNSNYLTAVIFAEVGETISHYAEWTGVSAMLIRQINGFKYGRFIHLNQKIKVPFFSITPDVFFQKRSEYHKSIQEDFFENYKVVKTIDYTIKKGVTVWEICNEIYDIPLWLLRSYNPDVDLENLYRGGKLSIPVVS
ncbi:MAG: LysM peptidoglycan-binding domain-containing protein [Nitrospinota bacterium]|nr:LysM peptidoglycan-binding domain-containing protein [Nitrospinota bacterium]